MIGVVKNTEVKPESRSIALDEIRLAYQHQDSLFNSIETKASFFLAVNGVALTLITTVFADLRYYFLSIIIFSISTFYSFKVLELRHTRRPHHKFPDWLKYAHINKKKCEEELLFNYMKSCENLRVNNNEKRRYLQRSILCLKYAVFSLVLLMASKYILVEMICAFLNCSA